MKTKRRVNTTTKKLTLDLGWLPLCTDNQLKYMKGNYTTKARVMRASIQKELASHRTKIKRFFTKRRREWVEKTGLAVSYTLEHNESVFRNKEGLVSMRKGDATNYLKGLNDFIFNNNNHCPNSIRIDDRFITCCTIHQKGSGEEDNYKVDKHDAYVIVEIYVRGEK